MPRPMKHRDYLADPKTPPSLHAFLEAALAEQRVGALPELYATTRRDFAGRGEAGVVMICTGDRVRVNDVGRFNDVGITLQIDEPKAYQARAALSELTDFSVRP